MADGAAARVLRVHTAPDDEESLLDVAIAQALEQVAANLQTVDAGAANDVHKLAAELALESLPADALYDWAFKGRPSQQEPLGGDWRTWLVCAGRGFGKTELGAQWIRERVETGEVKRIALVAATWQDALDVMVEGPSGLLAVFPPHLQPEWISTRGRIEFHNGAIAKVHSAEKPNRLRGPQYGAVWGDELAAWPNLEETLANIDFGLRLGSRPRKLLTTTPRPLDVLREMIGRAAAGDPSIFVTQGSMFANQANLPETFKADVLRTYAGTRLGDQEIKGLVLDLLEQGIIQQEHLQYLDAPPSELDAICVAIDPATGAAHTCETGLVATGRRKLFGYVLEDLSGHHTPERWAFLAVDAAIRLKRKYPRAKVTLYAETNRGGEMVVATLRAARSEDGRSLYEAALNMGIRVEHDGAYTGKALRAEPICALYEQRRCFHVGRFAALERQAKRWNPAAVVEAAEKKQARSPDRWDACVHGLTRLGFHLSSVPYSSPPSGGGADRRLS